MEHTSSENVAEALKLLEEAAKQKRDELKSLLSDKYTHLRSVIVDAEGSLLKSLSDARKHTVAAATYAKEVSVEKACEIAHDVDKHVHKNPWPYLAGTAAVGVLLGFILGRSRK